VGLERGPLSLVNTTEELLGRNSVSGLESRELGRRDPPRLPRDTPLPKKVGINSADKRQSLGRFSLLSDFCLVLFCIQSFGAIGFGINSSVVK
jgi:hypothetical protein